jgi:Cu-Zn family superoxide dismutase
MQKLKTGHTLLMAGLLALTLGGMQVTAATQPMIGKAVLRPTSGNKVQGWIKFSSKGSSLRVWGEVNGLTPGKHGFHVHEFGDCSAPDGASAGGHFALLSQKHGSPVMPGHHAGDMGNLDADAQGVAKFDLTVMVPMGINAVLGRGVIVHEKVDDFKTQPSGASGSRLACGVIGVSQN